MKIVLVKKDKVKKRNKYFLCRLIKVKINRSELVYYITEDREVK